MGRLPPFGVGSPTAVVMPIEKESHSPARTKMKNWMGVWVLSLPLSVE